MANFSSSFIEKLMLLFLFCLLFCQFLFSLTFAFTHILVEDCGCFHCLLCIFFSNFIFSFSSSPLCVFLLFYFFVTRIDFELVLTDKIETAATKQCHKSKQKHKMYSSLSLFWNEFHFYHMLWANNSKWLWFKCFRLFFSNDLNRVTKFRLFAKNNHFNFISFVKKINGQDLTI